MKNLMNSGMSTNPPLCPMCQQNAAVVAILNGLKKLDEAGKEPEKYGDFVIGGNGSVSESWCCKRCQLSFVDHQLSRPAPPAHAEDKNPESDSEQESRDGMPVRFMKKTFHLSGITVVLAKAARGKGYCVAISYPDGHQTVVEADSRAKAKRIASAYQLREHPRVM